MGEREGVGKRGGRTYSVDVEVACVENDGPVDVEVVHVLECDVLDISVADIWSGPSLESCSVLLSLALAWLFLNLRNGDSPQRST